MPLILKDTMTHTLDFLSDSDVKQIISLIDSLDRSNFDSLQLDVGHIKLSLAKTGAALPPMVSAPPVPLAASPAAAPVPAPALNHALAPTLSAAPAAAQAALPSTLPRADWLPVTATTMGRFYSRPDPQSPPYVQVGDLVNTDDTVCLIEVMKLFNAIAAGVSGTVVQVCVDDSAVVEFGQVLFYVQA